MDADVVVAGAGPAGAAAALVLARRGRRVVLVDPAEPPRDKPCGDLLGTAAIAALRRLGVAPPPHALRLRGALVVAPSGRSVGARVDPDACDARVVPRAAFDAALVAAACAAGASFVRARVQGVRDGRVRLQGGDELHAPLTIGADGWGSAVARAVGIAPPQRRGVALRAYAENVAIEDDCMRFYVLPPGDGYGWVFPLGGGRANVGLGFVAGEAGADALRAAFDRFACGSRSPARALLAAARFAALRTWPLAFGPRAAPRSAGGVLLAGDAAALVSPLSGSGIHTALVSGALAGACADDALARGDRSARALRRYDRLVRRRLELRLAGEAVLHRAIGRAVGVELAVGTLAATRAGRLAAPFLLALG